MTSWYPFAVVTAVSIAECHSKNVQQGRKVNGQWCICATNSAVQGITNFTIASFWPSEGADREGKKTGDVHDPGQAQTRIANLENIANKRVVVVAQLGSTQPQEHLRCPARQITSNYCVTMFYLALAFTCLRHSAEYVGQHCGVPHPNKLSRV